MRPVLSIRYLTIGQKDTIFNCFVGDWGMTRAIDEPVNNYDEVLDAWEKLWAEGQIGGRMVRSATLVEGGQHNGKQTLFGADKHKWNHRMPRIPLGGDYPAVLGPYWSGVTPKPSVALSNSSVSPSGDVESDLLEVPMNTTE